MKTEVDIFVVNKNNLMINRNTTQLLIVLLLLSWTSVLFADTPIFRVNNKGLPFQHNFDHDSSGDLLPLISTLEELVY